MYFSNEFHLFPFTLKTGAQVNVKLHVWRDFVAGGVLLRDGAAIVLCKLRGCRSAQPRKTASRQAHALRNRPGCRAYKCPRWSKLNLQRFELPGKSYHISLTFHF